MDIERKTELLIHKATIEQWQISDFIREFARLVARHLKEREQ